MGRARFGRGFGPVVWQTAKWMNEGAQAKSGVPKIVVTFEIQILFLVTYDCYLFLTPYIFRNLSSLSPRKPLNILYHQVNAILTLVLGASAWVTNIAY
jgi:hypothetical protein